MTRFLLLLLCLTVTGYTISAQNRTVIVRVVVPPGTPRGDTIYIAGNDPALGDWDPRRVAMKRESDSVWTFAATTPRGSVIEFKITRGSWGKQALYREGAIPPNHTFRVSADTLIILAPVTWQDLSAASSTTEGSGGIVGTVRYHRGLRGEGLRFERDVIVWLPPSYNRETRRRYPVLYMHDGQNVFDPATSFIGYDWRADETADSLISAKAIEEIIIVGIYNTPDRIPEYSRTGLGRSYARFVVERLKPMIDTTYRTKRDRSNTAVMGSSMGGLISFLFAWWHPDIFSKAGCLSTAVRPEIDTVLFEDIRRYNGPKKNLLLYFDVGEFEPYMVPGFEMITAILRERGPRIGVALESFLDRGAAHTEHAWANRLWRPLTLMFGRSAASQPAR